MTRASIAVEKLGIPTVSLCCDGFKTAGMFIARGEGLPNLPFAVHPGHVNTVPDETVYRNTIEFMADMVVEGLTVQPADVKIAGGHAARDIAFSGSFEEVNEHFLQHEWSDGLPVVPPTIEKVEAFLRHTRRDPDEVLGILKPENREATIWTIAVNGVMAGCRPEYMPILVAIVEALCDPDFGHVNLGNSPGSETVILLNGPIIKDLKFNCTQGVMRPGFQANTSVARFLRLYARNACGFLLHKTDKSCFGDNFKIVVAENEEYLREIGWTTYAEDRGFAPDDNVVTLFFSTEKTAALEVGWPTAEGVLLNIENRMADNQLHVHFVFRGQRTHPMIVLTPTVVDSLIREGFTKQSIKQHFYDHARLRLSNLSGRMVERFHKGIEEGHWPEQLGTSKSMTEHDFVKLTTGPDDYQLFVSGDPARDHVLIFGHNTFRGLPTCRKIERPENWDT
ncbi:hypothetical protein H7F51_01355 [Novosphingobium flavum]|uniref:UGSC-like domain-containing protein n=1 Tax=Novosphingobium flavum TaxID=1778672 RepID=A0A7X1FNQ7_9SPHN|nr:hypothetical protein [Novosphingobium flavum]MBC2664158.1 hypothetical protein [Novosphingobium flavum]